MNWDEWEGELPFSEEEARGKERKENGGRVGMGERRDGAITRM